jgi:hypothetical protein
MPSNNPFVPVAFRGITSEPIETLLRVPLYTSPILIAFAAKWFDKSQKIPNSFLWGVSAATLFGRNIALSIANKISPYANFESFSNELALFIRYYGNSLVYFPVNLIDYKGIFKPIIIARAASLSVPEKYRELFADVLVHGLTSFTNAAAKQSTANIRNDYNDKRSTYRDLQYFKDILCYYFCKDIIKLILKSYGYECAVTSVISGATSSCLTNITLGNRITDRIIGHGTYELFSSYFNPLAAELSYVGILKGSYKEATDQFLSYAINDFIGVS